MPRCSRVSRNLFPGGSTRTPPSAVGVIGPGSGRQPRTALATTSADDPSASPGPHAQPEAVGPSTATVVRLEGALHVRAPSLTSRQSEPTTTQAGGITHRCSGALVGPTHGTCRGATGSNRTRPARRCSDRHQVVTHRIRRTVIPDATRRKPRDNLWTPVEPTRWSCYRPGFDQRRHGDVPAGEKTVFAQVSTCVWVGGGTVLYAPHTVDDRVDCSATSDGQHLLRRTSYRQGSINGRQCER